jgi:alkaline phosphatase D
MPEIERRSFLAGAGALALAPRLRPPVSVAGEDGPFEWGVASFDPTPSGVLLWTRASPGAPTLRWAIAADPDLADVVASGTVAVGEASDHCAVVPVDGLPGGTTWWYRFETPDGQRSPVGRTRTLAPDAINLRIGVVSCSRFATAGFAAYRALADREVDLVVHLGDYIYEDGTSGARPAEPPHALTTLGDYRARYAQHRRDPDLQALHARHPMVAVWDDHDIAGNAWRDGAPGHDERRDGPWLDRLLAAGRAHEEWLPGRTGRGADGRLKAWRHIPLGQLAELVVLDTRAWGRDRQAATADEVGGAPLGAPPGSRRDLLGADQLAFASERLGRPDRPPWLLVANQVMLHPLEVPVPGESFVDDVEAAGFLVRGDQAVNPDQWDGYPQARDELLGAVGTRGGVVVLTGDVHSSWAWEGAGTGSSAELVELVAPSVSSAPLADRLPVPAAIVEGGLRSLYDDLAHVELTSRGYLLVDLDRDRVQGEWWYVDPDDVSTARFGAARRAPVQAPMSLTSADGPTDDPVPTSTTRPDQPTTTVPQKDGSSSTGRRGPATATVAGAGAAAVAAALAGLLAVRRRRSS